MKKLSLSLIIVSFLIASLIVTACQMENQMNIEKEASSPKGFAEYMYFMQLYTHKLLLSVQAGNAELADFYLHELEETTEDVIEHIKEYDGFPVSELTATMLMPVIEDLEDALDAGDWDEIRAKARILVDSCNACHAATEHGYIYIPFDVTTNPFLQDFNVR